MTIRPSARSSEGNAIKHIDHAHQTMRPSRGKSAENTPIGTPVTSANSDDPDADQQRHARGIDDARQRIAAELVGAEPMRGAWEA